MEKNIETNPVDAISEKFMVGDSQIRNTGEKVANHHILGYADGIQDTFQEIHVNVEPGFDWKNITLEEYKKYSEWILLFQLDTDKNADMMWGDGGRMYYMIKKEDLKAKVFDNVKVTMDCY